MFPNRTLGRGIRHELFLQRIITLIRGLLVFLQIMEVPGYIQTSLMKCVELNLLKLVYDLPLSTIQSYLKFLVPVLFDFEFLTQNVFFTLLVVFPVIKT